MILDIFTCVLLCAQLILRIKCINSTVRNNFLILTYFYGYIHVEQYDGTSVLCLANTTKGILEALCKSFQYNIKERVYVYNTVYIHTYIGLMVLYFSHKEKSTEKMFGVWTIFALYYYTYIILLWLGIVR